jgi:hypothetical protein
VPEYYDANQHWPAESLARRKLLRAKIDAQRSAPAPASPRPTG